jgi:16S rRNA (adenine1518-N6/adenine1519-N6)-dimethyltransferase
MKKKWGQNFLTDPNIIRKIVGELDLQSDDTVVEIGPGKGALTIEIASKVKELIVIEIDPLLIDELEKLNIPNLRIILQDVLKVDFSQFPNPIKIIGNLPYYITSPIIFKVLELTNWTKTVFMIQKEVAERIASEHNQKSYGRLSVMAQSMATVRKEFIVPSTVFFPKPKVDSAVISLKPNEKQVSSPKLFAEIVRFAFGQRRKKISNTLKDYLTNELKIKFGNLRPENLSVDDFIEICKGKYNISK